ncbi:MAG TPA: PrsW family glutamic-type intramembrane protease [Pirellulales bacterium]
MALTSVAPARTTPSPLDEDTFAVSPLAAEVPSKAPGAAVALAPTRRIAPAPTKAKPAASAGLRDYVYLVFALALLPLGWSIISPENDIQERLTRTIEANPDVFSAESADLDSSSFFDRLPGGRFEGAHLPHSTWVHWIYGLISAAIFLGIIIVAFERGQSTPVSIALVGLCTATAGIVLLLTVQFMAQATQGVWLPGRGVGMLVFLVMKLIGFSYNAAEDPENGFLLSFFGYTIGVGLCEELTKALPVIIRCRNGNPFTWRAAVMWGLASDVGFGVAEGIMYSAQYYNGIQSGEIYLVRFVSCVALHAVWSASVALLIWTNAEKFEGDLDWPDLAIAALTVLAVPMVLHGLYDTMLKKDMNLLALATAAASFVVLALLVEYTRRQQETPEPRRMLATSRSAG